MDPACGDGRFTQQLAQRFAERLGQQFRQQFCEQFIECHTVRITQHFAKFQHKPFTKHKFIHLAEQQQLSLKGVVP